MIQFRLLAAILLAAALSAAAVCASEREAKQPGHHRHGSPPAAEPGAKLDGRSVYLLDAPWTSADGKAVPLASLRGTLVVGAMVYTSCTYTCPLIVDEMKRIEKRLDRKLRRSTTFVLWSFDPERDSPAALAAYRAKRELDPARWVLLRADPDAVQELAAALGVRYRKEPDGEFSHSVLIHVLDPDGVLTYQQQGLNQDSKPVLAALHKAAR